MSVPAPSYDLLHALYAAAGQEHVFTFFDALDPNEQAALLSQLGSLIDPARVNAIYKLAVSHNGGAGAAGSTSSPDEIAPPPTELVDTPIDNPEAEAAWGKLGMQAIREGKVGVILLAGGQGTRLGSTDPKGCYDIGLPSGKSLFQLQAERIRRMAALAGGQVKIPWYIMTSGPTRDATEAYFKQHDYFGLDKRDVIFFNQGVLPCLTNDGKIFLDTKSSVAVAPDGNGGIYSALLTSSILSDMRSRGIQYLYTYCVDNCLARVADPVFLGYCIGKKAECGTKVVKKRDASESVGVVALKGGNWGVIEYSEISKELSQARNDAHNGELLFRAANIANHFYDISFLEKVDSFSSSMAYHIARKKIPHVDLSTGTRVSSPSSPNGMKLEQFIFDVLPYLQPLSQHALLEVERSEEFSPLKNAPGTGADDPQTSRRDLLSAMKRWLDKAGVEWEDEMQTEVELSPLVSAAGEGLEDLVKGKTIRKGSHRVENEKDLEKLFV